jgi:5-formyltetrahydrofolate cyclo-ligase
MNGVVAQQKAALRKKIRGELSRLSPDARLAASAQAGARLQQERAWREAVWVLLYCPLPDELDVFPWAQDALLSGKKVALPRFDPIQNLYLACQVLSLKDDLQTGPYGIREPRKGCPAVALNRLDFLIVPGVGFALNGRRLGRGKGVYDRLLASVRGSKCGAGFDEQIVDDLPVEPHDIRMDCILTPTRWRWADPRAVQP